jgi:hypothetical protein
MDFPSVRVNPHLLIFSFILIEVAPKGNIHFPASFILCNFCTDDSELSWKHKLLCDYTKQWWTESSWGKKGCQILVRAIPSWSAHEGGVCMSDMWSSTSSPPHYLQGICFPGSQLSRRPVSIRTFSLSHFICLFFPNLMKAGWIPKNWEEEE